MSCPTRTIWNCAEGDRVFSSLRGWYGVVIRRVDDANALVRFEIHGYGSPPEEIDLTYPLDCLVLVED